MSDSQEVYVPNGLRTVAVKFGVTNAAVYHYFIPPGDQPKVGDIVMTIKSWGNVTIHKRSKDITQTRIERVQGYAAKNKNWPKPEIVDPELDDEFIGGESEDDNVFSVNEVDRDRILVANAIRSELSPAVIIDVHEHTVSNKANRFYALLLPLEVLTAAKSNIDGAMIKASEQLSAYKRLIEIVKQESQLAIFQKVAETNEEAKRLMAILASKL